MTADEEEPAEQESYEPTAPTPPARAPPRRSTAPQSDYAMSQVGIGVLIFLVGAVLTVGVPFLLG